MIQEINFRSTTGYRSDDRVNTYIQTTLALNYPTVTPQGFAVGWESNDSPFTANISLTQDVRLAGIYGNPDTSECIYRVDLPSSGEYRIRCAAGADLTRVVYLRLFDNITLNTTLVSPQLTSGGYMYVDATDVERSGADWPSLNGYKDVTMSSTVMRFDNGGMDIPGGTYVYLAHLSIELLAPTPPSGIGFGGMRIIELRRRS